MSDTCEVFFSTPGGEESLIRIISDSLDLMTSSISVLRACTGVLSDDPVKLGMFIDSNLETRLHAIQFNFSNGLSADVYPHIVASKFLPDIYNDVQVLKFDIDGALETLRKF